MQNKEPVTASHYNLGHILFNNDMLQQSEKHFDSTVTLAKEFGPEVLHGLGLQGRAMVKYKLGDKSYKSDLEESFSINKDDLYYLEGAYQTMYTLAKEKNDFEMALDFLEQQNVVSDSINSKEVQEKISKSNERLATFKKEQELKVKEQELRLERRRILLAVFAIGILIVFLIFVFRLYQEIKKQKNYIDLLHKELTHRVAQIFSAVSTYIIYTKKKGGSFSDLQDRIKTLFNIFKLIQETGSHTAKELKEYLNAVTDEIRQSFLYDKDIKTKIEVTAGIGNKYVTLLNVTIAELYTRHCVY